MVHRNFAQTEEIVQNLMALQDKVTLVSRMLEHDRQDILGPAPNLLAIHHQLTKLEAFRNQITLQAKTASADARLVLTRLLDPLAKELNAFDDYIWEIARNILPIIRAGNGSVIVRLVKIAEVEGREDEKGGRIDFTASDCPAYRDPSPRRLSRLRWSRRLLG